MNILKVLTRQRLIGNAGERAASKYLKRRGYKILERNYIECGHEIDIIAENKDFICFVEVKSRTEGVDETRFPRPAAAVNQKKQRAIITASRLYCAKSQAKEKKFRFDVAEVYLTKKGKISKINYMENAFSLSDAYKHC